MGSDGEAPQSPRTPAVDTGEFFFDGTGASALLIHGLTGTPYEMRFLGERLAATGLRVRGVRLAGHAREPEDLGATDYHNWYESVVEGFEDLRRYNDPIVAVGLSCGALLAARLALDQGSAVVGLVMISPAFFLPPSATLGLKLVSRLGGWAKLLYLHSPGGSDIHDAAARRVHPTARLMPLSAPISMLELSMSLRPRLGRISQPLLLMHARDDHTCPMKRNFNLVKTRVGSARKRTIILEDSYHVITVDSEKERVAQEVIGFVTQFRVAPEHRVLSTG